MLDCVQRDVITLVVLKHVQLISELGAKDPIPDIACFPDEEFYHR